MEDICNLVNEVRNGDEKAFELLLGKMDKAISKYVRQLYKDDPEEVRDDLSVALWESCINMKYWDNNGQVITYLNKGLRNKFMELYRNSRKIHDNETLLDVGEVPIQSTIPDFADDIALIESLKGIISQYSGNKKRIYELMLIDYKSDSEITKETGISRQYVHRLRMELREKIIKECGK